MANMDPAVTCEQYWVPYRDPEGESVNAATGPGAWTDTQRGRVMLLEHGTLRQIAQIGFTQPDTVYTYPVQFYGHYDWTQFLAVAP